MHHRALEQPLLTKSLIKTIRKEPVATVDVVVAGRFFVALKMILFAIRGLYLR
jgi:hypothetical protein